MSLFRECILRHKCGDGIARDALTEPVESSRLKLGLRTAKIAERADMDLVDSGRWACAEPVAVESCTSTRLASVLSPTAALLLELEGLAKSVEPALKRAAVRRAANAELSQGRSNEGQAALRDIVHSISELPGAGYSFSVRVGEQSDRESNGHVEAIRSALPEMCPLADQQRRRLRLAGATS